MAVTLPSYRDRLIDDQFYIKEMDNILEAFPVKGPPFNVVQLNEHLYIGGQRNADDYEQLQRQGISFVLNCAGMRTFDLSRSPYPESAGIQKYLMVPAEDHETYDMIRHIPDAINFLEKAKQTGSKALVHCNLGVNRSGFICAAYLMKTARMTLLEVTKLLKVKRSVVLCNKGFRSQLVRYARVLNLLDHMPAPIMSLGRLTITKERAPPKYKSPNTRISNNYCGRSFLRDQKPAYRNDISQLPAYKNAVKSFEDAVNRLDEDTSSAPSSSSTYSRGATATAGPRNKAHKENGINALPSSRERLTAVVSGHENGVEEEGDNNPLSLEEETDI